MNTLFKQLSIGRSALCLWVAMPLWLSSTAQASVTWAEANSYGTKEVAGFNDEASIRNGVCLDWSHLVNLTKTGFSVGYSKTGGQWEYGALFHIAASAEAQKFDVWVLALDGPDGPAPQGQFLQVQMRQSADPTVQQGADPENDLPVVAHSQAMVAAGNSTIDPCWRHAHIQLLEPIPEGDYWFTVAWSVPGQGSFALSWDYGDSVHDELVIALGYNWKRGLLFQDLMMVISQETVVPCTGPSARIVAADAGKTNILIAVDGSTSSSGSLNNPTYAWTLVSKPDGSTARFGDASAASTTFLGDTAGSYVIQLQVSTACGSDTVQHTINLTEVPPPHVEAPTITPATVHSGDQQTTIQLSVTASDPEDQNPDFEYHWNLVRWDNQHSLLNFDQSASPQRRLLSLGLGDRGHNADTYYDITVTVKNTHTGLSTKSPPSRLTISQWPEIFVTAGEVGWGPDMTYITLISVRIATHGLGVHSGANSRLRLLDANNNILAEAFSPAISLGPNSSQLLPDVLELSGRLEWDHDFCYLPNLLGNRSETLMITSQAWGLEDDNLANFGGDPVPGAAPVPAKISVPQPKVNDYNDAYFSYWQGIAESVLGIAEAWFCPPCAVVEAVAEGIHTAVWLTECTRAHDDPPGIDTNYVAVVSPQVPQMDTTPAAAPDEKSRLAMVAAEQSLRLMGLRDAYNGTYNKLFGAYQAADRDWSLRQGTELIRLGAVLDREKASYVANLYAAQAALGVPSVAAIREFQQQVATTGLPAREIDALQQLGLGQPQIDSIKASILAADPAVGAAGLPSDLDSRLRPMGDFYTGHSFGLVPGGFVLVAVTDPMPNQRVHGTISVQARVVHKKEPSLHCLCGPTLVTAVQLDGQVVTNIAFPAAPWCPAPPQPYPQAVPVQIDTTRLADGPHTITVLAQDACPPGPPPADPRTHLNSETITIYVDNTPPTLAITSPDVDPTTPGVQVYAGDPITYQASDPAVGTNSSGLVDPFHGVISTSLGSGNQSVIVRVADRSGNAVQTVVSVVANPTVQTLGSAFTYQGRLLDGSNQANGQYDLRFSLYTAITNGTRAGSSVTNFNVAVSNGLFTTTIDFGPDVLDGTALWLDIGVRTNGGAAFTALSPRQQLTAAPYGIYASKAGEATTASAAVSATTAQSFTGSLAGDVTGLQNATVVNALRGRALSVAVPSDGQVLKYSAGQSQIVWGSDSNTTYAAGPGLVLNGTTLNVNFGGGGSGNTVARSDHTHSAEEIVSGTLPDGRLAGTYTGTVIFSNAANGFVGAVTGNGSGLSNLNAGAVTSGTLPESVLSANVARLDANQTFTGTVSFNNAGGVFAGNGSGLTALNAASLSSGTVSDARLSASVARLDVNQTFTGANVFSGATTLSNANNVVAGNLTGDGSGIYNVNAANLTGTVSDARLSANVARLDANQTYTGAVNFNNAGNLFTGNGAALTALNAASLSSGTVSDARLSANVARLNVNQTFTGTNVFSGAATLTNANNVVAGNLTGDGSGIYNVNAANLTGTVSDARLSANVARLDANQTYTGTVSFNNAGNVFTGNGAALTALNAASLSSGTVSDARLSATVARLNVNQTFTGTNVFSGATTLTNANNVVAGSLTGDGGGIYNVNAANLTGTVADGRLSANVARLDANQTYTGAVNFNNAGNVFTGNGAALTALNAASLSSGTFSDARLSANVARLDANQTYTGAVSFNNAGNVFTGNGAALNALNSGNLVGTVPDARLSANVALLGGSPTFSGTVSSAQDMVGQRLNIGQGHALTGQFASVAGGVSNTAAGPYSVVAGGASNAVLAGANASTVGGGQNNVILAGAQCSAIPGGLSNSVSGSYGLAAGRRARANHPGAFVWADSMDFDFPSTTANAFAARCTGGARFVSAIDGLGNPMTGVQLPPGGNAWSALSDRHAKSNFRTVDCRAVLEKVSRLPVTEWNLISQPASIRHIGPMAQDFHAAFGVGEDDRHISTSDADGVALAAIQGLNQKLEEEVKSKDLRIQALEKDVAELRAIVAGLAQQRNRAGQ